MPSLRVLQLGQGVAYPYGSDSCHTPAHHGETSQSFVHKLSVQLAHTTTIKSFIFGGFLHIGRTVHCTCGCLPCSRSFRAAA